MKKIIDYPSNVCYNHLVMTYDEKINYTKNFILSGLSMEESFLHASLSDTEIEEARKDASFLSDVEHLLRVEQIRLRELLKTTVEQSAKQRLDWKGVQTLLELTFPDKYGKDKKTFEEDDEGVSKVTIVLPHNNREKK